MRRCKLGCQIHFATCHHRRRRRRGTWSIVEQPRIGDRILAPRGAAVEPMPVEPRHPASSAGFNRPYAASAAVAAGRPGAWLSARAC